ncbi:hypothetical protein G5714_021093 [Onychostoma macrolepis]|uniref:tRNA-uridine aminocarboxypropyltransferase n=1 Tax=Onychostoma macrolepis TaxID=369639 RepID=A0A7J6BX31_9TELE|nr:hypothetical protein G5714_021093 [Onychostoma macrolepis]
MDSRFDEDTVEEMNEDADEDEEETKERDEDSDDEGFSVLSDLPVEKMSSSSLNAVFSRQSSAEGVSVSVSPATSSRRLHVSLHRPAPGRGEPGPAHGSAPDSLYPELAAVCKDARTLLLYPGAGAENLEDLSSDFTATAHSVILIDGTWSQAKDMFLRNALLRLPRQVQLRSAPSSQYVIRTQPNNMCVSTLECAAAALSIMEKNRSIPEVLLKPLQALCSFQLQHGAQIHHSKEHLIRNGQYNKIMPKNKRKIRRMQKLITNQNI